MQQIGKYVWVMPHQVIAVTWAVFGISREYEVPRVHLSGGQSFYADNYSLKASEAVETKQLTVERLCQDLGLHPIPTI